MNRAKFLRSLAGSAIALPSLAVAETPAEAAIYDLLDAAVDAQFTSDFSRLARMLHSASLRMFRDCLSARFDQLLRSFPLDRITSVSGLASHPKDLDATDREIFVAACNRAGERHPEFVGDSKLLPLKVHGTIFDTERLAHVLFSYSSAITTERTDFDYVAPSVFSVRRDREIWQVYSCILARRIIDDWWRDLAKPKQGAQQQPAPIQSPP
jgi:hypothetical protein